jgi:hypothetical protein
MSSVKEHGGATVGAKKVQVDDDGGVTNVGEMSAAKGFKLAGRVVLSDGKPIPPGVRIIIDRDDAWDSQLPTLDENGGFNVNGVPGGEVIGVSVSVPGYHLSRQNVSLDRMNMTGLQGLVDEDISDLRILLEPGKVERPKPGDSDWNNSGDTWTKIRSHRIQGAPPSTVGAAP